MSAVPVELEDSKTLSRQLDRCERELDRTERQIAALEERGEEIPEETRELQAEGRARIARTREKLDQLALIEKLLKRLERRRRDESADVSQVGVATLDPAKITSAHGTRRRG